MARLGGGCKAELLSKWSLSKGLRSKSSIFLSLRQYHSTCRAFGHDLPCAEVYILLCMFNGFAFARPFCRAIKGKADGVGI
jgi:hypothetical protein